MQQSETEQLAALAAWTTSADARAAAASELRARGLPDLVDDVCQDTYLAVARVIARKGPIPLEEGKTMAAYARRALHNIVIDLLRGSRRTDAVDAEPIDPADPETIVVADAAIDATRRRVFARLDPAAPWSASAALTVATLASDGGPRRPIGPQPKAGAAEHGWYWCALWLAGQRQCFATDGDDTDAIRKRRARAIAEVAGRLRAAVAP